MGFREPSDYPWLTAVEIDRSCPPWDDLDAAVPITWAEVIAHDDARFAAALEVSVSPGLTHDQWVDLSTFAEIQRVEWKRSGHHE